MAILSNGKFYGFLCSVKETGRKLANGVKEYVEDFVSGFSGHGWKLWEYVKGKWKLEIDTIVVRETMLVFEMLISKVRAIIGAQAITQGHGKVKSARLSDDGTEYLIELEGDDVSIVAHDFVRCQTFTGDKAKLYHVEVSSVDIETKTLHVPLSEFEQHESGAVLNPPTGGDELIQFGNSQNKARQSAIYMHADETGQPAIDVMFDLDSKNWEGKVKISIGGNIPGSEGKKGFYCENGMIKGVDSTGHTVYCIYPDGTAELGDGSARFATDRSGHIAGGAISWRWDDAKGKYVCTMGDVLLTWDNLSDETKENLKGKDANLLPWIEKWNGYATELGEEYIVTPKMFSGTKSADGKLTGIAQGKDCLTAADGTKRTGIFALVDNEIVFELDPINKEYKFIGEIESTLGKIGGFEISGYGLSNGKDSRGVDIDAFIKIDTSHERERAISLTQSEKYTERRVAALGNILPGTAGFTTASRFEATGYEENIALSLHASKSKQVYPDGRNNIALSAYGGCNWRQSQPDDLWRMPGILKCLSVRVNSDGGFYISGQFGMGLNITGLDITGTKDFIISHNRGNTNYYVSVLSSYHTYKTDWQESIPLINSKEDYMLALNFIHAGAGKVIPRFFDVIFYGYLT